MLALRDVAARALAALACCSFLGASCGQGALALMPGVVNDPHNVSLRRSHPLVRPEAALRRGAQAQPAAPVPRRGSGDRPLLPRPLRRAGAPGRRAVRRARRARLRLDRDVAAARLRGERRRRVRHRLPPRRLDHVRLLPPAVVDAGDLHHPHGGAAAGGLLRRPAHRAGGQKLTDAFGAQIMAQEIARGFTVIRDVRRQRRVWPRHGARRASTPSRAYAEPRPRPASSSPTSGASSTRTSATSSAPSRCRAGGR